MLVLFLENVLDYTRVSVEARLDFLSSLLE